MIRAKIGVSNLFIGLPILEPVEKLGFLLIASRFAIPPNWGHPFLPWQRTFMKRRMKREAGKEKKGGSPLFGFDLALIIDSFRLLMDACF